MMMRLLNYAAGFSVAAVIGLACFPCHSSGQDAIADEYVAYLDQLYIGEGVTPDQVNAVLAQIKDEIPEGAAIEIEIVTDPKNPWGESGGSSLDIPSGFLIRPLDDLENPYRDRYADWDKWELENYRWLCQEYGFDKLTAEEQSDFINSHQNDPRLYNYQSHILTIRGDGFMIPCALAISAGMNSSAGEGGVRGWGKTINYRGVKLRYNITTAYMVWSFGKMDDDMYQRMEQATMVALSPELPLIPQWIAANPPNLMMFVPDGEIVTLGPLGSWNDAATRSTHDWYRFDLAGNILGQTTPGQQDWYEMYFPEMMQIWEELGGIPDIQCDRIEGVITFRRQSTDEELASYTYKGEPLENSYDYVSPPGMFITIEGRDIPDMYAAQQAK